MSGSSVESTHLLHSQGLANDPLNPQCQPLPPRSCKKPVMWTVEEEAALLNFLYSHLGQVADGNFKKTTWNAAAAYMAQNFPPTGSAGNKTSEACEHKFKVLKKSYYAVSNLKSVASGFAYSDIDGAMIMLESTDLWEWYTKSHKEAKPFHNVRFPHFEGVE
ncbi:hypothetical protein EDC04DRAFT_2775547, partial [Pisolithus marmoratus]